MRDPRGLHVKWARYPIDPALLFDFLVKSIRRNGELADSDPSRIVNCVDHSWKDRKKWPLSCLFGSKRPLGVIGFNNDRKNFGHLVNRGNLVV